MTRQETELLMRSISDLRADMGRRMDGMEEQFGERFDKIDARLDAGDRRFAAMDMRTSEIRGMTRVALWIGSAVIAGAGAVGGWMLSHTDKIAAFLSGR